MVTEQTALDMPDGLRPPFYSFVYRYGQRIEHVENTLDLIISYAMSGEEFGEHSVDEIGDADGFLWKRGDGIRWEVADRAPWGHDAEVYPFWKDSP
jgi:hypothetical protein